MGEWKEYKLGDLIDIKHGFAFKGEYISSEPTSDILVTPGNFHIGGGFKTDKFKYYKGTYPSEYILNEGDLVVTMTDLSQETDTLGYSAKIPKNDGIRFLHNQRIGLVSFTSNEAVKDFIYWLMRTDDYQSYIVGSASGTSIMHTAPSRIKEYSFLLPPIQEQKFISSILSSLDDKIDLLHRQNKTLEALAETLFRLWFVEEADESWEIGKLGDVINIFDSKRIPLSSMERDKMKFGNLYPYYGAATIMDYINDYLFDGEYILMGEDGTVETDDGFPVLQMPTGKFWVNNHAHIFTAQPPYSNYFIYTFLKLTSISNIVTGAVQPKINQEMLKSISFPIPDEVKTRNYVSITNYYWDKMKANNNQIRTLTQLRDTLLPKLMSGEVRVK